MVKAFATIRDSLGGTGRMEVELPEDADVGGLLARLSEDLGKRFREEVLDEHGAPKRMIKIFVNGRDIDFLDGLSTRLKNEDEVALIPPVAGGEAL